MRKMNYAALFLALIPFTERPAAGNTPAYQGIEGHVYRVSGNQMPSPDVRPPEPKGMAARLFIYELTNLSQVTRIGNSPSYSAIHTRLVRKARSGKDGHFKVSLPPGHYSIFVKTDSLYFANWFDGRNNIAPVEVLPGKISRIDIKVDLEASY